MCSFVLVSLIKMNMFKRTLLCRASWLLTLIIIIIISAISTPLMSTSCYFKVKSQDYANYVAQLTYGVKHRQILKESQYDMYYVDLQADTFIRVIAQQHRVDITLKLFAPNSNSPIEEADSPTGTGGSEVFSFVADRPGRYRIEVHALAQQGEYELQLAELIKAGNRERARAKANRLHREAHFEVSASFPSYQRVISFEKNAITLLEELPKPYPPELAESLFHLGQLYRENNELLDAKRILQRAFIVCEQTAGNESLELAQVISETAKVLQSEGLTDQAERLFRNELSIRIKKDPDSTDTALSEMNIANIYRDKGDYKAARPLYQKVLATLEQQLAQDESDLTLVLIPYGEFCRIVADYDLAEQYFKRSLALYEQNQGTRHPNVALLLDKIATLYIQTGNFKEADVFINRIKQLQPVIENERPPDNLEVVSIHSNLGKLYFDRGLYAEAQKEYMRALVIRRDKLGNQHRLVANSLNNLAALYSEQDQFVNADEYYQKAMEIHRSLDGKTPGPEMADVLSNVGSLYIKKGDHREAELYYREALQIREQVFTPTHPAVAASLNQLATALSNEAENARRDYHNAGNNADAQKYLKTAAVTEAEAERYLRRALKIQESKLHSDNPAITATLLKLGVLYARQRRYLNAEQVYERALKLNRQSFGSGHPYSARILNELANLYRDQSRSDEAAIAYEQSLSIQEKLLGVNSQLLIKILSDYAGYCQRIKQYERAEILLERTLNIIESHINRNLGAGSEKQKLTYLATFKNILDQIIELDEGNETSTNRSRNLAFLALLRLKGRGLDEMVDRLAVLRTRALEGEKAPLDKLRVACAALSALVWREPDPSDPAAYTKLLETQTILEREKDKAEAEINKFNPGYKIYPEAASIADVQKQMSSYASSGAALIEFVVYNKKNILVNNRSVKRYAAYIFTTGGTLQRVDLGNANFIDLLIGDLRKSMSNKDIPESIVQRKARLLDRHIMQPIRASLGAKISHFIISPDGSLNYIPFASLVDEYNQYLVNRYLITYLTSGRDLLRIQHHQQFTNPPVLVGNPAFDDLSENNTLPTANSQNSTTRSLRQGQSCDLSQIPPFTRLPETSREVESIRKLLPLSILLSSDRATSDALRNVQSPGILHIATHGFYLCPGRIKNPLLRSGLALAGSNQRKIGSKSGVLMAMEVATLNLEGTQLAVLSACETGLGDVQNGEGVHGLRRALVLAGSASQVISLWEVSTYQTRKLMTDYYTRMLGAEKLGRGEALRQVQLKMLNDSNRRHPFYWAAFIQSGDWANLALSK